ncbi:ABC transporter permease [Haloferacaceae archaeon DSL9]
MNLRRAYHRWRGVCGLAAHRLRERATTLAPERIGFSVAGVSVAIALLLIVTGIGVGIAMGSTVYGDDVDYWITPDTEHGGSALVEPDAPRFGAAHETAAEIETIDGVTRATPVLTQPLTFESPAGETETVVVIGVVADPALGSISNVPTDGLTPNDPYYESGYETDAWTGEVVLSEGAAELLDVSVGEELSTTVQEDQQPLTVVAIESSDGPAQFPIAVVHLGELQTLIGATADDQADQFLVKTTDPGVESELEGVYPQSTVVAQSGLVSQSLFDADLPLALSLTAFAIAVAVGLLFIMTTTSLEIAADREQLATLAAIGFSGRTQYGLFAVQTLLLTTIGGVVGVAVGWLGIAITNAIASRTLTSGPIAATEPILLAYGFVVALGIGLCSLPAVWLSVRRYRRAEVRR